MKVATGPSGETLSGLIQILKDPTKVEGHLTRMKEAESAHASRVSTDRKELKALRDAITTDQKRVTEAEAAVKKREAAVSDGEAALVTKQEALARKQSEFDIFITATTATLTQREQKLEEAERLFASSSQATRVELEQKGRDLTVREKDVTRRETLAAKLKNELDQRSAELDSRATRLREALA